MSKTLVDVIREELNLEDNQCDWVGRDGNRYYIEDNGAIWHDGVSIDLDKARLYGIQQKWKPKQGETYFCIDLRKEGRVFEATWVNFSEDRRLFNLGIIFKTKEEAIERAEKMLEVIR